MNNKEKSVQCSFCNNEYLASAIGEHLMLCGNKTDQCPKCEKYIRRAVFAYHYENNCANLDESDNKINRDTERKQDSLPTLLPNNTSQSVSISTAPDSSKVMTATANLAELPTCQTTTASFHTNSGYLTSFVCSHCGCDYESADIRTHKEKCLQNPKNAKIRSQVQINSTLSQNDAQYNHMGQFNNSDGVPCEFCRHTINFHDYNNHVERCRRQYHSTMTSNIQDTYEANDPATVRCRYCHHLYMANCVVFHEKSCKQNPVTIALEEGHRSAYVLPGLYMRF